MENYKLKYILYNIFFLDIKNIIYIFEVIYKFKL